MANDHLIRMDRQRIPADADAVARSRLTGNGNVGLPDRQGTFQDDISGHAKDHGAGAQRFHGLPQAAGAVVFQVGHLVDHTAAATAGILAKAFRFRKSQGAVLGGKHTDQTKENRYTKADSYRHDRWFS